MEPPVSAPFPHEREWVEKFVKSPPGTPRPTSNEPTLHAPRLASHEREVGTLIKLGCLVVIALGVIYMAMEQLESILIPFMLALAISYLLTPLIDWLSCKNSPSCCCRCPRGIAVLLSIVVAFCVLGFVGVVLMSAVSSFRARSGLYAQRTEALLEAAFQMFASMQQEHERIADVCI